ncbi:MAG: hypothetical protein H7146_07820 [Burkholderiaceae bacterium]|nr:hypothetical protein [Microbacteriaceae bacterium]
MRLGAPTGSASLGWCAYTPLGGSTYFPSGLLLTPRNQFGLALLIVAVASIAFGAGLAVGLRRSRTTVGRADDRA